MKDFKYVRWLPPYLRHQEGNTMKRIVVHPTERGWRIRLEFKGHLPSLSADEFYTKSHSAMRAAKRYVERLGLGNVNIVQEDAVAA